MRSPAVLALLTLTAGPVHASHVLEGRDIGRGQTLYVENCAACHGVNLEGQPNWQTQDENGILPAPPHDQTGHTWHHDSQMLFDYTRQGGAATLAERGITGFASGMPAFSDVLSDDEIWNILAYIRSTWPKRIQDIQSMRNPPHD